MEYVFRRQAHFILSLRDLSADELTRLRKASVAHGHKLIPSQGSGGIGAGEFLSPGQPGSFQSIHVSNLTARGYVHEGKLSPLGTTFTQAIWRPEDLTPGSLGYMTWSGHNVAIISYEIGVPSTDKIANDLSDVLRGLRCKSFIAAITRDTQHQARLVATRGVLLIGDKTDRIGGHAEALKSLLTKVPTVGVLVSPSAAVPDGVQLLGVVNRREREVVLAEVCRLLFQANG